MPTNTVSAEDWRTARIAFLEEEKAFTRQRDALSAARRALPRHEIPDYPLTGADGETMLSALFAGHSQLAVYHFMFGPDWDDGCPSCSFWIDNLDRIGVHLAHRDCAFVSVARAPYPKLRAYWDRMGWQSPVLSSHGSAFNADMGVSFTPEQLEAGEQVYNWRKGGFGGPEAPGLSVFAAENGKLYRTYATFARGLDMLNGAYHLMDMLPKGRDEDALPFTMAWLRRRDAYED